MDAERLGRRSLMVDSAYCAVTGSILVAGRRRVSTALGVPATLLSAAGAATVGWAALVGRLSSRPDWHTHVGAVATANALAASGLAVAAIQHERRSARILLAAVAAEVAGFSVAQSLALRQRATAAS